MRILCAVSIAIVLLCAAAAWAGEGFTEVAAETGVAKIVSDHYARVPKWWLSGMTLVDLDGDGDLDLHLAGHGSQAVAAFNDGKGHFTAVDPQMSIPRGRGKTADIPYPGGEIRLVFDINEDGKPDVLASYGDGQGALYLNDCKPGKAPAWNFKTSSLFNPFSRAAAFADINRDGIVDYLVTADSKQLDVLLGKPDGTFAQSTRMDVPSESGTIPVDLDGDGDLDYLLSRRGYNPPARRILLNDGKMNFTDVTKDAGIDPDAGSIHGASDVDQDGDVDLITIEKSDVVIYLNDGKAKFTRAPAIEGLERERYRPKDTNWGGAVVTDFDHDGVADIIINAKYILYVLRGEGGGKFRYANPIWKLPPSMAPAVDEGLCFGDIDGDGDLDLVTYGRGTADKKRNIAVYRNDFAKGNWLRVRPIGAKGNLSATGAKIRIYEAGGAGDATKPFDSAQGPEHVEGLLWYEPVTIWGRQSFHSYYFAAQTERHFGLGERESVDVSVEFYPSGKTVEKRGVAANTTVEIAEP